MKRVVRSAVWGGLEIHTSGFISSHFYLRDSNVSIDLDIDGATELRARCYSLTDLETATKDAKELQKHDGATHLFEPRFDFRPVAEENTDLFVLEPFVYQDPEKAPVLATELAAFLGDNPSASRHTIEEQLSRLSDAREDWLLTHTLLHGRNP